MTDTDNPQPSAEAGPRFAQEAANLLDAGDVPGALALARAGTARYPWYPTGHLVLGRCLEASGSGADAAGAFRDARRLLPDAPVLLGALAALGGGRGQGAAAQPEGPAGTASDVDALARTLHGAKLVIPPPEGGTEQTEGEAAQTGGEPAPASGEGTRLVSATLAEIYVQQGQYTEAIRAYQTLIERQPDEREKYEKRIGEIEAMNRKAPRGD